MLRPIRAVIEPAKASPQYIHFMSAHISGVKKKLPAAEFPEGKEGSEEFRFCVGELYVAGNVSEDDIEF